MDIESECYPCIPMSSAIQLNAASLIGNHHLSNSTLTSPSSSISSISSLCNSSLSSTTNSQSTSKSDAQQFTPGRRGRKSKQQQANIIVTNCNNVNKPANKSQSDSKNSTLTALLNCSPLISTANGKANSQIACNLPPTPPASNSDSDCEVNSHSNGDRARTEKTSAGKPGRPSNNQNDASGKQVKRQRANNCSILVQSGSSVINLTQQLSPNSIKRLTVNTSPNGNSIEVDSNHSSASYSPSSSNYHLMNGGLKLDASSNLMHQTASTATHRSHRAGIQSMASLISCQPKTAASGTPVILTEEEKRTLIAEGNYRFDQHYHHYRSKH